MVLDYSGSAASSCSSVVDYTTTKFLNQNTAQAAYPVLNQKPAWSHEKVFNFWKDTSAAWKGPGTMSKKHVTTARVAAVEQWREELEHRRAAAASEAIQKAEREARKATAAAAAAEARQHAAAAAEKQAAEAAAAAAAEREAAEAEKATAATKAANAKTALAAAQKRQREPEAAAKAAAESGDDEAEQTAREEKRARLAELFTQGMCELDVQDQFEVLRAISGVYDTATDNIIWEAPNDVLVTNTVKHLRQNVAELNEFLKEHSSA